LVIKSIIDGLESGSLLAGVDKPKVSICTVKHLIREALSELADSSLDVDEYNLVIDSSARRGLP